MTASKRHSLVRAVTLPLSVLLLWQALGWIAFGLLEPTILERIGEPSNSATIVTVAIVMTTLTTGLGLFALYYWKTTSQTSVTLKQKTLHKCMNCGHIIAAGSSICPYCGSRTLF